MLIRNAEIWQQGCADLRITDGRIAAIGELEAASEETVVDAGGAALLPGLHDHHIHLAAEAARRQSVPCGPPQVCDEDELRATLSQAGEGWLRGINYHESVAGMLTRKLLDSMQPDRPVRIQDRTGRMWFFNSRAMEHLLDLAAPPPGLDRATGQLFDGDSWLRETLGNVPPSLGPLSGELARHGVTGVTDMSPANDATSAAYLTHQQALGDLLQDVVVAGTLELATTKLSPRLRLGPGKLHLHDAALPDPEFAAEFIREIHGQGRAIAIHCVTEAELVVALAAIEAAGMKHGDRIEHAGIAPDHLVTQIAGMGLQVCSNPAFIAARGDRYLAEVDPCEHSDLYRLAGLREPGIVLAAGSDAPYGPIDPWVSMRTAVSRMTQGGKTIGECEALPPEDALRLYLADPLDLSRQRAIAVDAPADLVLLDRPWSEARHRLSSADVRIVTGRGSILYQRVDQAPV